MYCSKCGNEIIEGSVFCSSCGNKIEQVDNTTIKEGNKPQNDTINEQHNSKEQIDENPKLQNKKSKIIIFIIIGIVAIGILVSGIAIINKGNNNDEIKSQYNEEVSLQYNVKYVYEGSYITFFEDGTYTRNVEGITTANYTFNNETKEIICKEIQNVDGYEMDLEMFFKYLNEKEIQKTSMKVLGIVPNSVEFGEIYSTENTLKEKPENYDLDSNINNTASNSSNPINETSNYNTAVSEIKKCLKDINWLKQNIYITEDEMISNDTDISDQQINFIVCKNNTKPIIVVETSSFNNLSIKIDLVTYENNKVKVERIGEGHNSHVGYDIDANKCVVRTEYMHMGACNTLLHSIVDGKINLLGSYGYYEEIISNTDDNVELKYTYSIGFDTNFNNNKEVSEDEYERYKKNLNEEQYNFVAISTELTSENIDLYINGY